jgi:hypothetical protein
MRYVIRVKGHLDPFWQEWFDHLAIAHQSDGTTLLSGPIRDQAALYGILCLAALARTTRNDSCLIEDKNEE